MTEGPNDQFERNEQTVSPENFGANLSPLNLLSDGQETGQSQLTNAARESTMSAYENSANSRLELTSSNNSSSLLAQRPSDVGNVGKLFKGQDTDLISANFKSLTSFKPLNS